ncbi:MAG: urease accessory protein UreE [Candidatus Eiseniibacteriota bacterium]
MLRATAIARAGTWPTETARDRITLGFEDRFRRRIRMLADGGLDFLLDLEEATVMHAGDGLRLEDGGYVLVRAAEEPLIEITAATPGDLARLAWHLGNRHLPAEIGAERILIRDDHVIVDMLKRLGAHVRAVRAPFNPEGGAYGQHNHDIQHPHAHRHDHTHGHAHDHSDSHDHDHDHHHHD